MPFVATRSNNSSHGFGAPNGRRLFWAQPFIVGGGGGGGGAAATSGISFMAGGGGGGGDVFPVVILGPVQNMFLNTAYTLTVGEGGNGGTTSGTAGATGGNSSFVVGGIFGTLTAYGGGGGAGSVFGANAPAAVGQGGGGGCYGSSRTSPRTDSSDRGGTAFANNTNANASGGGAGADGIAGGNASANVAGVGGDGYSISSEPNYFPELNALTFGAGAAGVRTNITSAGASGGLNTGDGGGGASRQSGPLSTARAGGVGGSGVIYIKVPIGYIATFSAGTNTIFSETGPNGFRVYACTSTGTRSVTFSAA